MIYRYLVKEIAHDIINQALKCHDKNGKEEYTKHKYFMLSPFMLEYYIHFPAVWCNI